MTLFLHFFLSYTFAANNVLNYVYGTILFWNYHHQHYELRWMEDGKEIVLDLGGSLNEEKERTLETFSDEIYVLRKSIKWMLLITMMLECAATTSTTTHENKAEGTKNHWQESITFYAPHSPILKQFQRRGFPY